MIEDLLKIPSQISEGYNLLKDMKIGKFENAVVCGMGGSAIVGQMAEMFSNKITAHSSFDLPNGLPDNLLVICVSWSGETEETISSLESAHENNLPAVVIATGGKIIEKAKEYNIPSVVLPKLKIKPRIAVGLMFGALFSVLEKAGIMEKQPISEIEKLDASQFEDRAEQLANLLGDKTPLIYTSEKWKNMGNFWKDFFNENAKMEAFANWAPNLDHNELAGLNEKDKEKFAVIIMEDRSDDPRVMDALERIDIMLEELGYTHDTIDIEGGSKLEKIFKNYLLAGLTSAKLAEIKGIDPVETPIIDRFKKI